MSYSKKGSKRREGSEVKAILRGSSLFSFIRFLFGKFLLKIKKTDLHRHQQFRHVGNEKRSDLSILEKWLRCFLDFSCGDAVFVNFFALLRCSEPPMSPSCRASSASTLIPSPPSDDYVKTRLPLHDPKYPCQCMLRCDLSCLTIASQ